MSPSWRLTARYAATALALTAAFAPSPASAVAPSGINNCVASTQTVPSPYVDTCNSGKVNFFQRYSSGSPLESNWLHRNGKSVTANADVYTWWRNHAERGEGSEPELYADPAQFPPGGFYKRAMTYVKSYGIPTNTTTPNGPYVLRSSLDHSKPAYLNYACGANTCTQYAGDIADPAFRAQRIAEMFTQYDLGWYKGLWIDDVPTRSMTTDGSGPYTNGLGQWVTAWSPKLGRDLTHDDWRFYTSKLMQELRAYTITVNGQPFAPFARGNAELLVNIKWDPNVFGGGAADANTQAIIGQADYVDLEGMSYDTNNVGGSGTSSFSSIRDYIRQIHNLGTAVVWDDFLHTPSAMEYSVAQLLLNNAGNDAVGLDNQTPADWWAGYDYDLGKATTHLPTVTNGLVRRDFANGLVLATDPGATASVLLDRDYVDSTGKLWKSGQTVSLASRTGMILRVPGSTGTKAGARRADFATVDSASFGVSLTTRRGIAGKLSRGTAVSGTRGTFVGDADADGVDEITALDTNGAVRIWKTSVGLGTGLTATSYASRTTTLPAATVGTFYADITGDKRADLVSASQTSITVDLTVSDGGLAPFNSTIPSTFWGNKGTSLIDVSGDKRADLITWNSSGVIQVAKSAINKFSTPTTFVNAASFIGTTANLACDISGDGKADFVSISGSTIRTAITNSAATGVSTPTVATGTFTPGEAGSTYACADFDADGDADIVSWGPTRTVLTTNNYSGALAVPFVGNTVISPADPLTATTAKLIGEFDRE